MKRFSIVFGVMAGTILLFAANPSFQSFIGSQFGSTSSSIWIKSGALVTNLVARGTLNASEDVIVGNLLSADHIQVAGTVTSDLGFIGTVNSSNSQFYGTTVITAQSNTATLGAELLTNPTFNGNLTGWTAGAGWSYSAGALHTAGNTATLSQSISVTSGKVYFCEIGVNTNFVQSGTLTATFGTYEGSYRVVLMGNSVLTNNGKNYFSWTATNTTTAALTLTPTTGYNGTLTNVSIKEVTQGSAIPVIKSTNSGNYTLEIRAPALKAGVAYDFGIADPANGAMGVAIGARAAENPVTAYQYTFVGVQAGQKITTGIWDTGIGLGSLYGITTGSGNTAIGMGSLQNNSIGNYNTGLGWYSGYSVIGGGTNVSVGAASSQKNIDGNWNVSIGGYADYSNLHGSYRVIIGTEAGFLSTNSSVTLIGYRSGFGTTSGSSLTAVGENSLLANQTGNNIVAIGTSALQSTVSANSGVGVGYYALANSTGAENVGVGTQAGQLNGSGVDNTYLGHKSGVTATSANANVTGANNLFLGAYAGPGTTTQLSYATAIGAESTATNSNTIALGRTNGSDAVQIYGKLIMNTNRVGETAMVSGTFSNANTTITAKTLIFLTRHTSGGTVSVAPEWHATAGQGFRVTTPTTTDTSTYNWMLVESP